MRGDVVFCNGCETQGPAEKKFFWSSKVALIGVTWLLGGNWFVISCSWHTLGVKVSQARFVVWET